MAQPQLGCERHYQGVLAPGRSILPSFEWRRALNVVPCRGGLPVLKGDAADLALSCGCAAGKNVGHSFHFSSFLPLSANILKHVTDLGPRDRRRRVHPRVRRGRRARRRRTSLCSTAPPPRLTASLMWATLRSSSRSASRSTARLGPSAMP